MAVVGTVLLVPSSLAQGPLAGDGALIEHYYASILGRTADAGGAGFWRGEGERMDANGVRPSEAYLAMARYFFASDEFQSRNLGPEAFVGALYQTFLNRGADGPGLAYWSEQITAGLPPDMVMYAFMFSAEFETVITQALGGAPMRAEAGVVVDFYRGALGRLPDSGGLSHWSGRFRAAQCLPREQRAGAVYQAAIDIGSSFFDSAEYWSPSATARSFVSDLYNAFMRRSADLTGFNYWVDELVSGRRTHAEVRRAFIDAPEFAQRVAAITEAGCPSSQAILGPLSGAQIRAYRLTDLATPIEGPITADASRTDLTRAGTFRLSLNGVSGDEWILVTATGGVDIDANDDGVVDVVPTANAGTIHAIARASQWQSGQANVNILSELVWQSVAEDVSAGRAGDLEQRLRFIANILLRADLTGDGDIDNDDTTAFSPHFVADVQAVRPGYGAFFEAGAGGKSLIGALLSNDGERVREHIVRIYGDTLGVTLGEGNLFVEAAALRCEGISQPCSPPTSSMIADFGTFVRDVLDGSVPYSVRFDETGVAIDLLGRTKLVPEEADDGYVQHALRVLTGQAIYAMHKPEIELHHGFVRFDSQDYPYHATYPMWGEGVESRYYCADYPYHCVILHIPSGAPGPASVVPAPAPVGTIKLEWFDLRTAAEIDEQVIEERRWTGLIGALTDRVSAAGINDGRIEYIGLLRMRAGDGSKLAAPDRDWFKLGSAGCAVVISVELERRSVEFTEVVGCNSSLGASLQLEPLALNGMSDVQRMRLRLSKIGTPMILPQLAYTATVRAMDFSHTPLVAVSDYWTDVNGAVFGAGAEALVLNFRGEKSAFTVVAQRKEAVLGEDSEMTTSDLLELLLSLSEMVYCEECDRDD